MQDVSLWGKILRGVRWIQNGFSDETEPPVGEIVSSEKSSSDSVKGTVTFVSAGDLGVTDGATIQGLIDQHLGDGQLQQAKFALDILQKSKGAIMQMAATNPALAGVTQEKIEEGERRLRETIEKLERGEPAA